MGSRLGSRYATLESRRPIRILMREFSISRRRPRRRPRRRLEYVRHPVLHVCSFCMENHVMRPSKNALSHCGLTGVSAVHERGPRPQEFRFNVNAYL
ncbi:hypothetical protein EVAR_41008_1 [Eumeta japonica]|uniref:Uncharacterized protein n=1 Tax=Eumeta variegata TaxID=151549 RepID=A0A4C1XFX2_EUMVA|nr:hypothetical protein EVAR_41008_1 [Eumeta japonica]